MIMPLGTYMTPNRVAGLAADCRIAVSAGTMLSSSGKASVAPRPRSMARRGMAFLVIIIEPTPALPNALPPRRRNPQAAAPRPHPS